MVDRLSVEPTTRWAAFTDDEIDILLGSVRDRRPATEYHDRLAEELQAEFGRRFRDVRRMVEDPGLEYEPPAEFLAFQIETTNTLHDRAGLAPLTDASIAAMRERAEVSVEELDAALQRLRELRGA